MRQPKKPKGKELTPGKKRRNCAMLRVRETVEHTISGINWGVIVADCVFLLLLLLCSVVSGLSG